MTKREAKRLVAWCVASLISNGQENGFVEEDDNGVERSEADRARMQAALDELADELERRGSKAT